jgi:hypothetical protein
MGERAPIRVSVPGGEELAGLPAGARVQLPPSSPAPITADARIQAARNRKVTFPRERFLLRFDHCNGRCLNVDQDSEVAVDCRNMSYLPAGGDPQLEAEAARERQRLIEMKAERYAHLHQDDDDNDHASRPGAIRRALRRARAALSRRR